MNQVILVGRLARKPELKTSNGKSYCRFCVACDREKEGVDFVNCVCFDKTADNLYKYKDKGDEVAVSGSIRTGSYEKNGEKVYTTDVSAYRVQFIGSRKQTGSQDEAREDEYDGFRQVEEDIPF